MRQVKALPEVFIFSISRGDGVGLIQMGLTPCCLSWGTFALYLCAGGNLMWWLRSVFCTLPAVAERGVWGSHHKERARSLNNLPSYAVGDTNTSKENVICVVDALRGGSGRTQALRTWLVRPRTLAGGRQWRDWSSWCPWEVRRLDTKGSKVSQTILTT